MTAAQEQKRPSWFAWILPLMVIAVWCAPAVGINIAHGLQAGSEAAIVFLSIMAVFFTALCALRLDHGSAPGIRVLAGFLVLIGVTYNLSNAIGLVAGHSESMRSTALTEQGVRQSLHADLIALENQIAALNHALGNASIPTLSAEIAELERDLIFDRTQQCTDATLGESRAHCAKWDKAKDLLQAAEQRQSLQAKLSGINAQLRDAPVRESVDPKAEAVAKALAFAGLEIAPDNVRYGVILLPAVIAELMAAFGAAMCGVRLPSKQREEAALQPVIEGEIVSPAVAEAPKPMRTAKKRTLTVEERVDLFISRHVQPGGADDSIRSGMLYEDFKSWWQCEAPDQPMPSQRAFYLAMAAKGFTSVKRGGMMRYENAVLMPLTVN